MIKKKRIKAYQYKKSSVYKKNSKRGKWSLVLGASSVMSNSLLLFGQLLCPLAFPGKNTGVGCQFLLLAGSLLSEPPGKPKKTIKFSNYKTIHLSDKIVQSIKIPFLTFPNSCLKLT